jgi:signal peptidase
MAGRILMARLSGVVRAVRRLFDGLLLALILLVLFGVVLGKLLPLAGAETLVVGGGSMAPAIPVGSAVVVSPVDPRVLAPGDVVSLRAGPDRAIFTHRIIRVVEGDAGPLFETKGDANAEADPTLVPPDAVIGRVAWTAPYAGYLITLLSMPLGVAFVIGLAFVLLAIAWLLETLELRQAGQGRRLLRKVAAARVRLGDGMPTAGRPLWASPTGDGVAQRLARRRGGGAVATRPHADGWRAMSAGRRARR